MPLVEYTPDLFESLRLTAERLGVNSLVHAPFVNYYYTANSWCRLNLLLVDDGSIAGMIGIERMPFAVGDRDVMLAFASNYHAARSGAGGHLYLHWMKTCSLGLVFGGSEFTHRILRQQGWRYFSGVKVYSLNRAYPAWPGEPLWRRWAKRAAGSFRRTRLETLVRRVPARFRGRLAVSEETTFIEDMLPKSSPFTFRFAPTLDYLNWRYRPGLSFVRYRLFRIHAGDSTAGYVILNDAAEKIIVAQCDGTDAETIAYGVLLSLAAAARGEARCREVMLAASHPGMQAIYESCGFRCQGAERPFVIGSRSQPVDVPGDSRCWHVNFDWGDNGLRAPFLDQSQPRMRPATPAGLEGHRQRHLVAAG
jgi:hypothetical protein